MRILKVTQAYHPFLEKGGPAVKVPAIAERLAKRGHRVTVLTVAHDSAPTGPQSRAGVEVIYLRSVVAYRSASWNAGVRAFCKERLRGFDVAHIYGLYDLLGPMVAFYCRRRGVPYVVEPMGMYRPIVRSLVKKRLYHWLLGSSLVTGAELLIATSQLEQQELLEEGVPPAKVVVRRNGLDLDEFAELPVRGVFRRDFGIPLEAPLVLYLGRLSRKKGLDLLIRAFAGAPASAFLAVAGPDERDGSLDEVRRLCADRGLESRVRLVGPRFALQKLQAFVDADVFVLPSQNENFGNAVAEAIACGTPAIVTDRCGIAPLVEGAALVVSYDEEELRVQMTRMIEDVALRERLRADCRKVAGTLGWDQPLQQMEAIYRQIAGEARAA
jgi:glycosyltransferase involved in cell wall biosynthesis